MVTNVAEGQHASGNTRRAIEIVRDMLREDRTARTRTMALTNLAGYLAAVDDRSEACAVARAVIHELAAGDPGSAVVAMAMEHLALALALGGDMARAASLGAYADAALRRHGFQREYTEQTTHDRLTALLRDCFDAQDLSRRLADGAALAPEAAVADALNAPELVRGS